MRTYQLMQMEFPHSITISILKLQIAIGLDWEYYWAYKSRGTEEFVKM